MSSTAPLMRSSALMASGTLVSRVLGLVRLSVLAAAIGVYASADAFDLANKVPNNIYILIAGGVLNAVLVPQITRAARDPDGGREYVNRLLTVALAGMLVVTVLVTLAAPLLVRLLSEGWDDERIALATVFAFWCLPQVFFYGVYTLLGQVLNARGSFGPYMWAPVANNVVAIAGLVLFLVVVGGGVRPVSAWDGGEVALLAGTATLGVVAQALVLLPSLRASGFRYTPRRALRGSGLGRAGRVARWTFAGVLVAQLGFIVTSRVTTSAGSGQVGDFSAGNAVYTYAFLLFMLPHSLVAVSLVTALFTQMSSSAADSDTSAVRRDLSWGLRHVGVASLAAVALMAVLGGEITRVIFPTITEPEARAIWLVSLAMFAGLPAFSALYLVQRVFYAWEDARTPFTIQVIVASVWVVGNLVAALLLEREWTVVGVGAAMSLANVVGFVVGAVLLRRRLGHLDGHHILRTHVRLVVAVLPAAGLGLGTARLVRIGTGDGVVPAAVQLAAGGTVMLAVYLLACRAMRVREVTDVLDMVTTRLPLLSRRPRR